LAKGAAQVTSRANEESTAFESQSKQQLMQQFITILCSFRWITRPYL